MERTDLEAAYARVFRGPDGELVLGDLLRRARFDRPLFSRDALEMAHAEGARTLALQVLELVRRGTGRNQSRSRHSNSGNPESGSDSHMQDRAAQEQAADSLHRINQLLHGLQRVEVRNPGAESQGHGKGHDPEKGYTQ